MKCSFVHLKTYQQQIKPQRQPENNIGLILQPLSMEFLKTSCKILTTFFWFGKVSQFHSNHQQTYLTKAIFFLFCCCFCFSSYPTVSSSPENFCRQIGGKISHSVSSIYSPFIVTHAWVITFAKQKNEW